MSTVTFKRMFTLLILPILIMSAFIIGFNISVLIVIFPSSIMIVGHHYISTRIAVMLRLTKMKYPLKGNFSNTYLIHGLPVICVGFLLLLILEQWNPARLEGYAVIVVIWTAIMWGEQVGKYVGVFREPVASKSWLDSEARKGRIIVPYTRASSLEQNMDWDEPYLPPEDRILEFKRSEEFIIIPEIVNSINLYALRYCTNLKSLDIGDFCGTTLDITSLSFLAHLQSFDFGNRWGVDVVSEFVPKRKWWSRGLLTLRQRQRKIKGLTSEDIGIKDFLHYWKSTGTNGYLNEFIKFWVLDMLDLIDFADLDIDLYMLIKKTLEQMEKNYRDDQSMVIQTSKAWDWKIMSQKIEPILENLLEQHLASGGSTFFMKVGKMKKSAQAVHVPRILELRQNELSYIDLDLMETQVDVDLSPLWLTVYGRSILKALDIETLTISTEKFTDVKKALRESSILKKMAPVKSDRNLSQSKQDFILHYLGHFKTGSDVYDT